jgi:hypothetical protein
MSWRAERPYKDEMVTEENNTAPAENLLLIRPDNRAVLPLMPLKTVI